MTPPTPKRLYQECECLIYMCIVPSKRMFHRTSKFFTSSLIEVVPSLPFSAFCFKLAGIDKSIIQNILIIEVGILFGYILAFYGIQNVTYITYMLLLCLNECYRFYIMQYTYTR